MAITYPLTVPSRYASVTIRPRDTVAVSRSPFTFSQQVQAGQGDMWEADVAFPIRRSDDAEAGALRAFLAALRGPYGTFLLGDPLATAPRLNGNVGAPVVSGAGQTGRTLVTTGWTTDDAGYALRAGDYIQVGTGADARLYMLTEDAALSGSDATLSIWPKLRVSPADAAPIVTNTPQGVFRMAPGQTPGWTERTMLYDGISFTAIEAL